jgi:hypothetical protein
MSELESLIKENRELFDYKEPDKNHENRFKQKLNMTNQFKYRHLLRIAAIIVFGLFIFASGYLNFLKIEDNPDKIIADLDPELRKAVYYYDSQNTDMIEAIKAMDFTSDETKNDIIDDIENYDNTYKDVLSDLRKYPDNDRVINAFLEHYRFKTELLGFIIAQLNESQQAKDNY